VDPHTEPGNNPTVAHEHTDADSHAITRFGITLAFLVVFSQLLLWWLFNHFSERETKQSPHVPAIVKMQGPTAPPEPRLQGKPLSGLNPRVDAAFDVHPRLDLKQMREDEDAFLNHYGWIDPDRGVVHIPIDKALDIVAGTGLPKFKPMEPAGSPGAGGAAHASPASASSVGAAHASPASGSSVGATHASPSKRGTK